MWNFIKMSKLYEVMKEFDKDYLQEISNMQRISGFAYINLSFFK